MRQPPVPPLMPRRSFLATSLAAASALVLPAGVLAQGAMPSTPVPAAPDSATRKAPKPPPLPDDMVREFVGAAHGNLTRTREMLDAEPGLLNATWDWKAGDFETALGGAGHMGRRDIAEFLIARGARVDLFVAAMLGQLDIVRAMLAAYPALAQSKGPHGITLIAHAEAGGVDAAEVLSYLRGLPKG
jgi:hypothetical protein